jgi:hypothetical protein
VRPPSLSIYSTQLTPLRCRIALHPAPSNNPHNWALAAAAYTACWALWLFAVVLVYEGVYCFARRWRVLAVYLSAPAYALAGMTGYAAFCFLQYVRWGAWGEVRCFFFAWRRCFLVLLSSCLLSAASSTIFVSVSFVLLHTYLSTLVHTYVPSTHHPFIHFSSSFVQLRLKVSRPFIIALCCLPCLAFYLPSLPSLPLTTSLPSLPLTTSLPSLPLTTSLSSLPLTTSLSLPSPLFHFVFVSPNLESWVAKANVSSSSS